MSLRISLHNNYSILLSFIHTCIVHYDTDYRDNDRHHKNVKKLREALKPLLRKHLDEKNEFKFWCEARLGRLAWRASEADLHERIKLSDVSKHYDKEFYTR